MIAGFPITTASLPIAPSIEAVVVSFAIVLPAIDTVNRINDR
jgi:hypothetical protein